MNRIQVTYRRPSDRDVVVKGHIGEEPVTEMFMDSGADISIIEEHLLPEGALQCYPEIVNGITRDTALVEAEIGGTNLTLYAAVVPKGTFSHPVIVGRDTLDHKVVWTHTLVPKTDTDGGITVTEEENQSSSVTPPTVQGPGEKTGEVKQSRRKNKFGSAASAVPPTEVVGSSSDTPPTVQGPGEKTGEVQMEKSRRKNKFGSAARAVPPTEVVGSSSDTPPTVQGPGEKTGEVKQMEKSRRKKKFGSAAAPPTVLQSAEQSVQSEVTVVARGSTVLQQEADTLPPRKGQLVPGALQPDWRRVTFPEEVTEVKAVQTRAQKKKEAQQRKQDQEDTELCQQV